MVSMTTEGFKQAGDGLLVTSAPVGPPPATVHQPAPAGGLTGLPSLWSTAVGSSQPAWLSASASPKAQDSMGTAAWAPPSMPDDPWGLNSPDRPQNNAQQQEKQQEMQQQNGSTWQHGQGPQGFALPPQLQHRPPDTSPLRPHLLGHPQQAPSQQQGASQEHTPAQGPPGFLLRQQAPPGFHPDVRNDIPRPPGVQHMPPPGFAGQQHHSSMPPPGFPGADMHQPIHRPPGMPPPGLQSRLPGPSVDSWGSNNLQPPGMHGLPGRASMDKGHINGHPSQNGINMSPAPPPLSALQSMMPQQIMQTRMSGSPGPKVPPQQSANGYLGSRQSQALGVDVLHDQFKAMNMNGGGPMPQPQIPQPVLNGREAGHQLLMRLQQGQQAHGQQQQQSQQGQQPMRPPGFPQGAAQQLPLQRPLQQAGGPMLNGQPWGGQGAVLNGGPDLGRNLGQDRLLLQGNGSLSPDLQQLVAQAGGLTPELLALLTADQPQPQHQQANLLQALLPQLLQQQAQQQQQQASELQRLLGVLHQHQQQVQPQLEAPLMAAMLAGVGQLGSGAGQAGGAGMGPGGVANQPRTHSVPANAAGHLAHATRRQVAKVNGRRPWDLNMLNQQLMEIVASLQPTAHEQLALQGALDGVTAILSQEFPQGQVHLYGSAANGLLIARTNDLDICLDLGPAYDHDLEKARAVTRLGVVLQEANMDKVVALPKARVPLVKFIYPATGTSVDITINNLLPLANTRLLSTYAAIDPRLRQLVLLVKHWAKTRGVNDTYRGTLSSYAYVLLCVGLLQQRSPPILPVLQQMPCEKRTINGWDVSFNDRLEELQGFGSSNQESLADLFVAFFDYWGRQHDYNNSVLSIRTGGLLTKKSKDWTRRQDRDRHLVCIEDPFELTHDLGRCVDWQSVHTLRDEFERAARILATEANPLVKLLVPWQHTNGPQLHAD